jgi:hypothetical protein
VTTNPCASGAPRGVGAARASEQRLEAGRAGAAAARRRSGTPAAGAARASEPQAQAVAQPAACARARAAGPGAPCRGVPPAEGTALALLRARAGPQFPDSGGRSGACGRRPPNPATVAAAAAAVGRTAGEAAEGGVRSSFRQSFRRVLPALKKRHAAHECPCRRRLRRDHRHEHRRARRLCPGPFHPRHHRHRRQARQRSREPGPVHRLRSHQRAISPNGCKDQPDDPRAGKFCSLCGPKFNQPITVFTWLWDDSGKNDDDDPNYDGCPPSRPKDTAKCDKATNELPEYVPDHLRKHYLV